MTFEAFLTKALALIEHEISLTGKCFGMSAEDFEEYSHTFADMPEVEQLSHVLREKQGRWIVWAREEIPAGELKLVSMEENA